MSKYNLPIIQKCDECGWHRLQKHMHWCAHIRPAEWAIAGYPPPYDCPLRREIDPVIFPSSNDAESIKLAKEREKL